MAQAGRSFLPLTGALFAILFIAAFVVGGETPGADDPIEEVVAFYADNESSVFLNSVLGALGAVAFLFFVGHIRSVLRAAEGGPGTLSSVAAGGGIVAATGMLIFAGLGVSLTESTDNLEPAVIQALNVLNQNFFFPLAGGIVTFLLASGIVGIRRGGLPSWLAWSAIIIAIAGFTPLGFFAFLASILWVLVASILLWSRQPSGSTTT